MLCENELFLRILYFFNIFMTIVRFVIPIILIVKTVLDVYHQVLDVNDNAAKEKIAKRIFAVIILFLVPTIINVFLSFMETITGYTFNYSECNYNATPEKINEIIAKREEEEQKRADMESIEYKNNYKNIMSYQTTSTLENKDTSGDTTSSIVGKKITNLTDSQIDDIAKVCQKEQGTPEGSGIEAELMVNKYILDNYQGSLYDYLFSYKSGWWSPIKNGTYKSVNLNQANREAVRKVIVEGQRKWPGYINEHDCFNCADISSAHGFCSNGNRGDICNLTLNGNKIIDMNKISSRSNQYYVKNQTVINNISGATYIFYGFVQTRDEGKFVNIGDPFGYTSDAKTKYDSMSK